MDTSTSEQTASNSFSWINFVMILLLCLERCCVYLLQMGQSKCWMGCCGCSRSVGTTSETANHGEVHTENDVKETNNTEHETKDIEEKKKENI